MRVDMLLSPTNIPWYKNFVHKDWEVVTASPHSRSFYLILILLYSWNMVKTCSTRIADSGGCIITPKSLVKLLLYPWNMEHGSILG